MASQNKEHKDRIVVGISGASGVIYGVRLLQILRDMPVETHLVMSKSAEVTLAYETDMKVAELRALADECHAIGDMAASLSSGSFKTLGMIVAPCSVRSVAEIATGVTTSLVDPRRRRDPERTPPPGADGARDAAASRPSAHHGGADRDGRDHRPAGAGLLRQSPEDARRRDRPQSIGRVLDLFGLDTGHVKRWGETDGKMR